MSEERDVKQEINKCSPNNFQFADDIEVRSMRAAGSGGGKRDSRREGEQRDSSRGGRSEADSSMSEKALAIKMSQ